MLDRPSTVSSRQRPYLDPVVRALRNAEAARQKIRKQYVLAQQLFIEDRPDLSREVFRRARSGLLTLNRSLPPAIQRVDSHFKEKYREAFELAARYWTIH